jgi:hypothetical protein
MKKLIGMSLVALLAITTASPADAQIFSKIKNKVTGYSDEPYKVKEKDYGIKVKDKESGVKSKVYSNVTYSSSSYYGYTTVKNKPGKKAKVKTYSTPYAVVKNKPGKGKVKVKAVPVRYATVKSKNGKYKVKGEQYATVKTKTTKNKVKF